MWLSRLGQGMTLALIAVIFLAFVGLSKLLLGGWRLDLTEARLYTLTDGTRQLLADLDEPITLHFFFSDSGTQELTGLRAYSSRVQAMLEEYQRAAGAKLALRVIDPEPFSEEEDLAAGFGLQNVPVAQAGQEGIYFGLAGSNAVDDLEIIPFFQPERERYLEYDLSKLIHRLANPGRPRLGLYADLPVMAQANPETFERQDAWVVASQLQELFDLEEVASIDMNILQYDLLLLVHPKNLAEEGEAALFALDQFLMQGGRLLAFVDPLAEADQPGQPGLPAGSASSLNALTGPLGVTLREGQALADADAALTVAINNTGSTVRHLGILGFGKGHLSQTDLVTAPLENLHFATAGIFDLAEVEGIQVETLVHSSDSAMPMPAARFQYLGDPQALQDGFVPTGEQYPVAVRVSGALKSQYPDGIDGHEGEVLTETDALQLVLVADTDLLTDRLWVQVQNFFGNKVASPFADNGSFLVNLAENLSGSNALINVRSRGQFSRPFDKVETLRRQAEASYRQKEEALQARLEETERQLSQIKASQLKDGQLTLTAEQADALRRFQQERVRIRKELREVRHQLDRDIENLGNLLKFLNIVAMPLLLTGLLILWRRRRQTP